MAVYSMTGYANVQHSAADTPSAAAEGKPQSSARLGLEIRSVNSRFLDLGFRLSDELRQHEPALRELLTKRLKRGKVEVRAAWEQTDSDHLGDASPKLLQRLGNLQDQIRAWLPEARPLSVADVLRLGQNNSAAPTELGVEQVLPLAEQALTALLQARARSSPSRGSPAVAPARGRTAE